MTPQTQLAALHQALEQLRQGRIDAFAFSTFAGEQALLYAALPRRFTLALDQLRDRLESSASFIEESCSFSQRDLWDAMQAWIDRARGLPELLSGTT